MNVPTAAILVIGDEILSGKVEDANARLLIGELRELVYGTGADQAAAATVMTPAPRRQTHPRAA